MRFIELNAELKKGTAKIYLVQGEDFFLRLRAIERITASLDISCPELNIATFSAEDGLDRALSACLVAPFLSEKRLTVLYDYPVTSETAKTLADFLKNGGDGYCLVIVNVVKTQTKTADGIVKVDCDKLGADTIAQWIDVDARRNGKTVSRKNALSIAERCGCDMSAVKNEMCKLVSYSDGEITEEDIAQCVTTEPEYSVFRLTDSIAKKDLGEALILTRKLVKSPDDYPGVMALIYGNFRRMFFAKNSSGSDEETASALGVKPFAVKLAREKASAFGVKKLMQAMNLCLTADERMKTSVGNKDDALELLIIQLCNL